MTAATLATAAPLPDREETLAAAGGVTLHLEQYLPKTTPLLSLVFIHGYSSYGGLYRHVAAALSARGIAVTLFDCRGHGRSTGRRGYVSRFEEFLDDLDLVVARARATAPELPWALLGHSHGGTVALDYTLSRGAAPGRLVLAAPMLGLAMPVPAWKTQLGRLTSRLWPTLALSNGLAPENVSRTPLVIERFASDPLVHHVATSRWFAEASLAQQRIHAQAERLSRPTLLLLAGQEKIVDNKAALTFAEKAGGRVQVRNYADLYHEVFLEPERDQVIADIAEWLTSTDSAAESAARGNGSAHKLPRIL